MSNNTEEEFTKERQAELKAKMSSVMEEIASIQNDVKTNDDISDETLHNLMNKAITTVNECIMATPHTKKYAEDINSLCILRSLLISLKNKDKEEDESDESEDENESEKIDLT